MKIFHGTENANILKPTVLTLGVFDGLHLGHQQIMETVVDRARATKAVATAITFDPHPRAVLHPDSAPPLLQTLDQRLANFEVLGIEQDESTKPMFPDMPDHPYKKERKDFLKRLGRT